MIILTFITLLTSTLNRKHSSNTIQQLLHAYQGWVSKPESDAFK